MVIDKIVDIDPMDSGICALDQLGARYGLFNMTAALMSITQHQAEDNTKLPIIVSPSNYRGVVRLMLALAALNFASVKHEHFQIRVSSKCLENYVRTYPPEVHRSYAIKYIEQAKELIEKYK